MTPAARLSAAIELIDTIDAQRVPAAKALKEWGTAHRYAGSGDRAGISGLIWDVLRRRASSAWLMDADTPRARVLGMLKLERGMNVDTIAALCDGGRFAPEPLTSAEQAALTSRTLAEAPPHVAGDYPEWLAPAFAESFGAEAAEAGRALAERAPVDLRVNVLKSSQEKALAALAHLLPVATPLSPIGLRIAVRADGRGVALSAEPAYVRGLVEVQDEGSQLATLLSGAKPGQQVLDLCAGAGGKTLAMAGMMANQGQIYATDTDGRRLAPIFSRLERSGARNVQVRAPRGAQEILRDLEGRCDLVFVDAPCSGTGAWRRSPDAKWRMRPGALEQRIKDQIETLETAARYVKPGGRIVYVTCSVLEAENEDRITSFLEARADFLPLDAAHMARAAGLPALVEHASRLGAGLRLDPLRTATDGFYIAALTRAQVPCRS